MVAPGKHRLVLFNIDQGAVALHEGRILTRPELLALAKALARRSRAQEGERFIVALDNGCNLLLDPHLVDAFQLFSGDRDITHLIGTSPE